MAVINKTIAASSLPITFNRGNPVPLDKSAVWYSLDELKTYAKSGATAYVGQILAYVDEANNKSTAYIILDKAGTLQEVGSATVGDDKTITLEAGKLKMKNWGIEYYKWVDAVGEVGQAGYVAGHHEKQIVDETHPWIAGLEPKSVAGADGTFEIAWYQPSTTTIEGLSSTISTIRTSVDEINKALGDNDTPGTIRGDLAGKIDSTGGTLTGDLTMKDGGKALSNIEIAALISSAGHLKRSVVEALPEIVGADKDTIYMIKDTSITSGDAYKEYMLIDGAFVQIGDTSVDLTPYAKKVVPAKADNIAILTADGSLSDSGKTLAEIVASVDLSGKVDKVDGKSLIADTEITRLASMATIKSIGDGLVLSDEGVLTANQYDLPIATASKLGGVKVTAGNGLTLADDGTVAMGVASTTAAGAMTAEMVTKLNGIATGAEKNVIAAATIGGEAAIIDSADRTLNIPVASVDQFGVVKAGEEIAVSDAGKLEVNKISTTKLYTPDGESLVLNGGSANS